MRHATIALLCLLLAACGGASAQGKTKMDMFAWWPTESAPKEAPVFLLNGDIALADGGSTYVPDQRDAYNGLGAIGSTEIVGDEVKAPPASVRLRWFSYTEDRFYAGEFDLPQDRIAALVRAKAAMPDGRRADYDYVVFGMMPGGLVSVWLSTKQVVTEVAQFVAAPADVPWSEVIDNPEVSRAEHIRQTLEATQGGPEGVRRLAERPIPAAAWATLRRKVAWTPRVIGADGALLWLTGLNGERDWYPLGGAKAAAKPLPATLPLPRAMILSWRGPTGNLRGEIALDPAETLAAFAKLAQLPGTEPTALVLEPADTGDTVDLSLRRGSIAYRFEHAKVQVFGAD